MAAPPPAGVLASSAGVHDTMRAHMLAMSAPSTVAASSSSPTPGLTWGGSLFWGLAAATVVLAVGYKRLL